MLRVSSNRVDRPRRSAHALISGHGMIAAVRSGCLPRYLSYMLLSRCTRCNKKANAKETTSCVDSQCVGLQLDDYGSSHLRGYDSSIIIYYKSEKVKFFLSEASDRIHRINHFSVIKCNACRFLYFCYDTEGKADNFLSWYLTHQLTSSCPDGWIILAICLLLHPRHTLTGLRAGNEVFCTDYQA